MLHHSITPFGITLIPRRQQIAARYQELWGYSRASLTDFAILARAFAGKLVSQDPNDEPAERLLKRIHGQTKSKSQRDARK